MKKIAKQVVVGALMGIGIGHIITIFTSLLFAHGYYSPGVPSFLNQFSQPINGVLLASTLYAFLGFIFMFSRKIYALPYSLLAKSLLHFCINLSSILFVGKTLHWFDMSLVSILVFVLIFFFIYMMIWTITYLIQKKEIQKINQKIKGQNQ